MANSDMRTRPYETMPPGADDQRFSVFEAFRDATLVLREGRIVYMNPAAVTLAAAGSSQELASAGLSELLPDMPDISDRVSDMLASRPQTSIHTTLQRRNGARMPVQLNAAPWCATPDADTVLVIYPTDVSAEQAFSTGVMSAPGTASESGNDKHTAPEYEQLLACERVARVKAELAAGARDEFLSLVAHELRGPLNAIQSWTHILESYVKDTMSDPLTQRALHGIRTGVAQQVALIEDLLDLTRLMSGRLQLARQAFALLPVIQAAVGSVHGLAAAKRISISCSHQITGEQMEGDADRVQQLLYNLLSVAIKLTPVEGSIRLNVRRIDKQACITIRGNGMGISAELVPRLFECFSQEHAENTRARSGLGLGVFLVQYLTELHGGTVKAESGEEGKGTVFTVAFPLQASSDS